MKTKIKTYTHCRYCKGPKAMPKKARPPGTAPKKDYVDLLVYQSDPYCSRKCLELDRGIRPPGEDRQFAAMGDTG